MRLKVISTGSAGNAYLLYAGDDILILDAGVSISKIVIAVDDWDNVVAALISHEHMDHAFSCADLLKRGVPVFMSAGTKESIRPCPSGATVVEPLIGFKIGRFTVKPFPLQHDAAQIFGFLIRDEITLETALYITDSYYVRYKFPGVHTWIIEANYCESIVHRRIDNGEISKMQQHRLNTSHMSLRRLLDTLAANDLSKTHHIVLVHLSDSNSDERQMISSVHAQTGIDTVAATNGAVIELELAPF